MSNGIVTNPNSLHSLNPIGNNQYVSSIQAIGEVLQNYDTDKMFPTYGFGGLVLNKPSMCFALNGNIFNPEVQTVQGVMNCYMNSLQKFPLHGPTNMAPLIN